MEDWREINKTLVSKIQFVLETGRLSDVKFVVGSGNQRRTFHAHRFIMAANSSVFEALLYGSMADKSKICMSDVEVSGFAVMLRYFYTERVTIETLEEAFHTCYVATKFKVHALREKCIELLEKCMSPESACKIYDFATKMGLRTLQEKCLKTFSEYTKEVTVSESFKTSAPSTVQAIIQRPFLSIPSESYLLQAVVRWGQEQCSRLGHNNLKAVLKPILQHVIMSFIVPEELVVASKQYGVPTREQLISILRKMVKPVSALPTPFEPPDWAESVGLTLSLYLPQAHRKFVEVAGKRVSFAVEVTSGSLFLRGFVFTYKSLHKGVFTLLATIYLTVPRRFERLMFIERLTITEQSGLCYVFFPRGVYLEAGEHLDTAIHFENSNRSFQCELTNSSRLGHRVKDSTVIVVRCTRDSDTMIIADVFGNYCARGIPTG